MQNPHFFFIIFQASRSVSIDAVGIRTRVDGRLSASAVVAEFAISWTLVAVFSAQPQSLAAVQPFLSVFLYLLVFSDHPMYANPSGEGGKRRDRERHRERKSLLVAMLIACSTLCQFARTQAIA